MSRIAYVNGRYVPHRNASVHIEDRGYQFSDGVYEVITVVDGKFVDEQGHLDRLDRSLSELAINWPVEPRALKVILAQVVRRNLLKDGLVYFQVTRGVAPRLHTFSYDMASCLVVTAKHMKHPRKASDQSLVSVITIPDIRWERCDIKTVSLLPNCLGKQKAMEAGAYEAWQVDRDGFVTEGTSSNAWIVTNEGELLTRASSNAILTGITRQRILKIAAEKGLKFVERSFTVAEAKNAKEAFVSSASSFVKPVTKIDDSVVGNGEFGEFSISLYEGYHDYIKAELAK